MKLYPKEKVRLDKFLKANLSGFSMSAVKNLISKAEIKVNGKTTTKKGILLKAGDVVECPYALEQLSSLPSPQSELPCKLIAATNAYIVIEKPAGLHTVCKSPLDKDTVVNWIAAHHAECLSASPSRLDGGCIQRLDKFTSGLILAAKNKKAHSKLRNYLKNGKIKKKYLALVTGYLKGNGEITLPLTPYGKGRKIMTKAEENDPESHPAKTLWKAVKNIGDTATLVELDLITGVRHQLRAHMSIIGHPIVGDTTYGWSVSKSLPPLSRYFLHCFELKVPSLNGDKTTVTYKTPLPQELEEYLKKLM